MGSNVLILPAGRHTRKTQPLVGIVIQARQTSQRFPGKSMAKLDGKPVLQHVIERCKQINVSKKLNKIIVVAVPDTDESEPLIQLAAQFGIENFCGSEDNVLERYYEAAKFFKLDHIMRITADCPLINPIICAELLDLHIWRKCDYSSNSWPKRTYPKGLDCEVFTFDCL